MATLVRSYKYRIYPTVRETKALEFQLSEAARLYNAAVQERREAWKLQRKLVTFREQDAQLRHIRASGDVGIASADVASQVLRRVDLAYRAFFRRVKARSAAPGFPRFKSSRRYDSLSYPHPGQGVRLTGDRLRVYGVGSIKTRVHRQPEGTLRTAVIKREAGRWYVVFSYEREPQPLPVVASRVGIDVGLTSFIATSDGQTVEAPRLFRASERLLRRAQRKLARCRRGSNRRKAQRSVVARVHARVRNQRDDFNHKISRQIVNGNQVIAVEDLNVSGLAQTRLAKSIHDAAWTSFIDKLTYKAENAGRQLVKVDPRGTSQTCVCGASVPKRLKDRWHECHACGLSAPRDVVSARIILARSEPAAANTGVVSC